MGDDDPGAFEAATVLVVEDDDDFAALVTQWLETNPLLSLEVHRAATLAESFATLGDADAVLLDLTLPDERGLRTVKRVMEATSAAVIVLTGVNDEHLAVEAFKLGIQEYLVKDAIDARSLLRTVRYSVERSRLAAELRESRARESRLRDMQDLERLAHDTPALVTSGIYGQRPARQLLGERYLGLEQDYRTVIERQAEAQAYRTEYVAAKDLRVIADVLGYVRATPRDVVHLHAHVFESLVADARPAFAEALASEARVVVLELMGYLVSHYRARAIGSASVPTAHSATTEDRP